jgi:molybdenum cofactor cytidylyltransferase
LRKGVTLAAADVAALQEAGLSEVIVAALEAGDVDENTAAARLAEAVRGKDSGLEATKAFTGRVNLLAEAAGVIGLEAEALHRINAVHPMITIATVPPWQQLGARGMAATVKIISYAVPETALETVIAVAGGGVMRLHRPVLDAATLIVTEIPKGAGEKGVKAISGRLNALDVELARTVVIPHDRAALSRALAECETKLVLILTGSATSDLDDVAPAALRDAGGSVTRFGMPVDPGNLLFIGTLGERQIIGLPGCARSPALNGADWVLSRVICGVPVTGEDIAAMGVGGLLKEIPTRPQPRRGR